MIHSFRLRIKRRQTSASLRFAEAALSFCATRRSLSPLLARRSNVVCASGLLEGKDPLEQVTAPAREESLAGGRHPARTGLRRREPRALKKLAGGVRVARESHAVGSLT
jgi:hypothetical protein